MRLEQELGWPLDHVRLHTDQAAQKSTTALGVRGFTIGSDIYLGPTDSDTATPRGRRTLTHEVAHVVQQSTQVGPEAWGLEAERNAEEIARALLSHAPLPPPVRARRSIQGLPDAQKGPPLPLEEEPTLAKEAEAIRITAADRDTIKLSAAINLGLAAQDFGRATEAYAAAIKNEAKAKAEMIAAVVDVVTGFLAPVFANWMVAKLATQASGLGVSQEAKQAFTRLISKQDVFKAAFTGATKIGNQIMKSQANALFGETEIDAFAKGLRNAFENGISAIGEHLASMPDDQLLTVWVAYNRENANEDAYRAVLADIFKRYQQQVEPLGTKSTPTEPFEPQESSELYEVQLATRKRLANLTVWSSGEKVLWAWVTPDMENIAKAKAMALGLGIPTITLRDVQLSLGEFLGRPDLRTKDMLDVAYALGPAERQRAASDQDVATIVENGREMNGRVPNQYERHKVLFVLRGFSDEAIACLDELDSWFPSGWVVDRHLKAASAAERARLVQDPWFVARLHAELSSYELDEVLYTLGLGPAPKPPERFPSTPLPPPGIPWW